MSRKASYTKPEIKVIHLGGEDVIRATGPGPGPDPPDYTGNSSSLDEQILNGAIK